MALEMFLWKMQQLYIRRRRLLILVHPDSLLDPSC